MKVGASRPAWPWWQTGLCYPWIAFWRFIFVALEFAGACLGLDEHPADEGPFATWPWWHRTFCNLGEFAWRQSMLG
jgi:hypothetical protein